MSIHSYYSSIKRSSHLTSLFSFIFVCLTVFSAEIYAQPSELDFQRNVVAENLDLPLEFEISKDGRVFVIGKCGKFWGWNIDQPAVTTPSSVMTNVRCAWEEGAMGLALDPNFTQNGWVYIQYTAIGAGTRVSRFTVNPDFSLNAASESILLEWYSQESHGHMGGSLKFDLEGNLLIATGDNKAAGGGHSEAAQETSGSTNDLRGKILRIRPTASGGYTIPAGNLFGAGDSLRRPEIYGMGFRNPFRINIDSVTGYVYTGDIGPDASTDLDEINELRAAGNWGWPWANGTQAYPGFDANNLINNYHLNTGATNIPNAEPSIWSVIHRGTMVGPVYRFNDAVESEFKLPAYYNGRLIFWDFNSSRFFSIDVDSDFFPKVEEEMPLNNTGVQGAIDVELDPRTHQLYMLQWGTGCCGKEPFNNGILYRYDYIGDRDVGTNIALSGTATESSFVNDSPGALAIDGDPTTRWESEFSDPQWIEIDLGQAATIDTVVLTWEAAYSSQYEIQASNDGVNWTVLVDQNLGGGGVEVHIIGTTEAYRYVRLMGTVRGTAYGHSIYEFEVYAGEDEVELTEHAYLNMPRTLNQQTFEGVPQLLSQTGVFADTSNMILNDHIIPYTPNAKLWSDRALKDRWLSLPADTQIDWDATANWDFPEGTVAIKHFELPLDDNNPAATKRLETRLLVMQANGRVYGVTYKWRADNSDAELLTTSLDEDITVLDASGNAWTQTWTYPSPDANGCLSCHNSGSAQFLGLSTRQLNGEQAYPGEGTHNQLAYFNDRGLFTPGFSNAAISGFARAVSIGDTSATLEHRVKSYLDVNCAHCHGTGNGGSQWDARYNTPVENMLVVDHPTTGIRDYFDYYGITNAQVVNSQNPLDSILYIRDKSTDELDRMPPVGRALEHVEYIAVLEQWMNSLTDGPLQSPSPTPTPTPTVPPTEPRACTATSSSQEADYFAQMCVMVILERVGRVNLVIPNG